SAPTNCREYGVGSGSGATFPVARGGVAGSTRDAAVRPVPSFGASEDFSIEARLTALDCGESCDSTETAAGSTVVFGAPQCNRIHAAQLAAPATSALARTRRRTAPSL